MGHGTGNDYERDYERDDDQRQKGNQNEVAPADSRVRSRQRPAFSIDDGATEENGLPRTTVIALAIVFAIASRSGPAPTRMEYR